MTHSPPPSVGDVIAERVRKYRLRRDWTVRRLAEECAKRGAPQLTVASLGNIERGVDPEAKRKRRDVTAEELLVLAYALDVPPIMLMLPFGDSDTVEVCPGLPVGTLAAEEWIGGSSALRKARMAHRPYDPPEEYVPGVDWERYGRALDPRRHVVALEGARNRALRARRMLHADDKDYIEDQQRFQGLRVGIHDDGTRRTEGIRWPFGVNIYLPEKEYTAERRDHARRDYERAIRGYGEALWNAAEAGVNLPPVPRALYDDLTARHAELETASHDLWDQATDGAPEWQMADLRPPLPPGVRVAEEDDADGR